MLDNEKKFKSDADYFADMDFISHSQLKDFFNCEYFYESKYITKTFIDEEERDYFIFGSGVDAILTEKAGTFEERFYTIEEGKKKIDVSKADDIANNIITVQKEITEKIQANKAHKGLLTKLEGLEQKLQTIELLGGKIQISKKVCDHIRQSAGELLRQPLYKMFGVGSAGMSQEIIAITIDGIKRKGKFDYLNVGKKIIADVKTCANIEKFNPRMYATQLAYYRRLASVRHEIDTSAWDHYLLVVDKINKYKRSKIYCIANDIINEAEKEIEEKLKTFVARREIGFFTPITEVYSDYADSEKVREEVCFKCGHYNDCPFSLQKEIQYIS